MIIAVTNMKGGVGKTSTAFTLGAVFAEQGSAVHLWEMNDEQSDLLRLAEDAGMPCARVAGASLRARLADTPADYHIIECPPLYDNAVDVALDQSDMLICPTLCEYLPLQNLGEWLDRVGGTHPEMECRVLITMYSAPFKDEKSEIVASGIPLFKTVIPRLAAFPKSQRDGRSILEYPGGERGAKAYRTVAGEIQKWQKSQTS